MTTIAFLGTGLMGTGFIRRARANGLTVRAWNRSAGKAQALAAADAGITSCASVAEAVRGAERIHLSLGVKGRRIFPSRGRSHFPTRLR